MNRYLFIILLLFFTGCSTVNKESLNSKTYVLGEDMVVKKYYGDSEIFYVYKDKTDEQRLIIRPTR